MTPPYDKQQRANYLLGRAVDIITWMSGSSDFASEGIAGKGWVKARKELAEIQEYLRTS